jgi:tetratricopeptide (TPR) repeat protein
MPNSWAEEYLESLLPDPVSETDDSDADDMDLDNIEDPMGELYALWQHSGSADQCLRLAVAILERCATDAPASLVADLIECVEDCRQQLLTRRKMLPALRAAVEADPGNGDSQAELAFALDALGESEEAMTRYRKALEHHPDDFCILNFRDCLNNTGWNLYRRKQYEDALPWFVQACWIVPSPSLEMAHGHTENLEPPYKLAFENILLCLAKLGRLPEAAEKLTAYFDQFGRLPRYETEALRKLGLDANIAFIRRQIEKAQANGSMEALIKEDTPVSIEPISTEDSPAPPTGISIVTKESVEKALDEIDSGGILGVPKNRQSTAYCLVTRGRHYPPKYVLSRARKIQGVKRRGFRGGPRTNVQLQNLGYVVIEDRCGNTCNFLEEGDGRAAKGNEKTRQLRWVEYDRLGHSGLGHGVVFLYSENEHEFIVAFLEGFGWRDGGPATVRLAKACPLLIAEESWSEIIASARQAVGVILSDDSNLTLSFRHGPIHILING